MNDPNAQAGPSGGPATDGQPKITAIFKSSAKSSAGDVVVEAADILDSNTSGMSWTRQAEDEERSRIIQSKTKDNEVTKTWGFYVLTQLNRLQLLTPF